MSDQSRLKCVVIGAGPAGLTAANELSHAGLIPIVLEQDRVVGGIARTVEYQGYRFDIGGHRFFSKTRMIEDWWKQILGSDMLECSRLSRIHYKQRLFDYPIKPLNAMLGLGPVEAAHIAVSYGVSQIFPYRDESTFEQWVCNRFGRRLYEIFFKNYTEKVWGMKCSEIGSDWAAQRIKNLDLQKLVRDIFVGNRTEETTSLIRRFRYPRLGPGMMWERVAEQLDARGYPVLLGHKVKTLNLVDGVLKGVSTVREDGTEAAFAADHFISSMPIRDLVFSLATQIPDQVAQAARLLRYRDFLTVGLIIRRATIFDDNWIYVHSPDVKVGRIQNFKNWSPDMVPDNATTSLGLEYFVQKGDDLWSAEDQDLISLAKRECAELGLINEEDVEDGVVIRMEKAYPVYDRSYKDNLSLIRSYLETIPNLQLIGRNGQHRYNNQDHSMLTGIYAARNIVGANYDLWNVNTDSDYHEDAKSPDRMVPLRAEVDYLGILRSAFARYDPYALGSALAVASGLGLLSLAAPFLLDQDLSESKLLLLRNYLVGFDATWTGTALGVFQVSAFGFVLGFAMAGAINLVIQWHERRLFRKLELAALSAPLEEPHE